MPRYTRMVGWLVRTTTLVLTVLVGGGPAIAVVCETIVHRMQRSITQEGGGSLEHHHPVVHEDAGTDRVDADHVDHQQTDAAAGDSRWSAFSRDCCRSSHHLGIRWRLRESTRICSRHLTPRCSFGQASRQVTRNRTSRYGPPVGDLSPARVPLVLRI